MSVIFEHTPYFRDVFKIDGFLKEPFLLIGIPRMDGVFLPKDFDYINLVEKIKDEGIKDIQTLDYFDQEADIRVDLNRPIPKQYKDKYNVLFDFGTLEHVFDTKRCLQNYFEMIRYGGIFILVTSIKGYFGHGVHVFNPETLKELLRINGFKIKYFKYVSSTGIELKKPNTKKDEMVWIVAKKIKDIRNFNIPQEIVWKTKYKKGQKRREINMFQIVFFWLRYLKRKLKS